MGDQSLTYSQLITRIDKISAGGLGYFNIKPGDRVALILPNCLQYMEMVAGFSQIGAPCAMIPPMASEAEIIFMLEDCSPVLVVCHYTNEEVVRSAAKSIVANILVVGRISESGYEDWLGKAHLPLALPVIKETDIFSIPYSSGATGKPKGIMLSHRSRILSAYVAAAEYRAFGPDTKMLVSTPIFHGAGFLNLLAPLCFGGQAIILPKFKIHDLLSLVEQHQINKAHLVPAHFSSYFNLSVTERSKFNISSLKCLVSGTAPLSQEMKIRIVEAFGPQVLHERYGSTEASLVTNLRPEDQLRKLACVGNAFAMVEIELRDSLFNIVADGEVGELWSRSPLMFSGYWNKPGLQAQSVRNGWVTAGDLAKRDSEGYIYLVDRKNDMIISGGENIYPREIEEVLLQHPKILEVAVVGLPHEYWGEALTAVVHLKTGTPPSINDLRTHCLDKLARWKHPKYWVFTGPLPRNGIGKILRRDLKEMIKVQSLVAVN
jgi:long-chain acyl-CoA synthetase